MKLTAMNLTMTPPAIPREKILLIEGIHDLVCSKDDIEDLWQSWGQPDIWRLPYGHVRICCGGVPGLPGRVLRWLAPRFDKPFIRDQMPPPNKRAPGKGGITSLLIIERARPALPEHDR